MIKTITMFKKIENVDALLKFYIETIFPTIHQIPGVLCTDITKVYDVSPDIDQDVKGLDIIMETHFESEEVMNGLVFSKEGYELMSKATQVSGCEISFFVGKEKRFSGELTDDLRKTIAKIGYEE
ncbi:hypothetical protein MK805_09900 [Shimazuella sp. AN120528]|uniref:hypothetical protein n=1 Tax=Shimazuella soli TaxID=1892854 RepID=UPI001F10A115|nr:hypothetical protein [Shimazuella soli]MCH5585281.1 hypothetical protein [Shimazuella soli]